MLARPPHPALRPFVTTVWATRRVRDTEVAVPLHEHVLPTGAMYLVFRVAAEPLRIYDPIGAMGACAYNLGSAVVGGARANFYVREAPADGDSVGAMLRPGAAGLLFGLDADAFTGRHVALEDLWCSAVGDVLEQLAATDSPAQRLTILEAELMRRLPQVHGLHPAVATAIARFGLGDDVAAAVARSGYSHRHFIALFRRTVGLSPKTYCRVLRFQQVLREVGTNFTGISWADVAVAAGYSDQAHFNRDFLAFAGITPSAYRRIAPAAANHVPVPEQLR